MSEHLTSISPDTSTSKKIPPYEPTELSFGSLFKDIPEPANDGADYNKNEAAASEPVAPAQKPRTYPTQQELRASLEKANRELQKKTSQLGSQELEQWLRKILYENEDTRCDASAAVVAIITELWQRSDVTFFKKFSIIQQLEQTVAQYSVSDGYDAYQEGSDIALKNISKQEKNFFLQSTVEQFLKDSHPEHSLADRREMIQRNWVELSPSFEGGVTHLYTGFNSYEVPGEALSAADLPEEIIQRITDGWLNEEQDWFNRHQGQEFFFREKIADQKLQKVFPNSLIDTLSIVGTPSSDCYRLPHLREFSAASLSPEYGTLYNENGGAETVYQKADLQETPITLEDLSAIGWFLVSLGLMNNSGGWKVSFMAY